MTTTLANSLFANGEMVLRTLTEDLSPPVENEHIILRKNSKIITAYVRSKETVPKLQLLFTKVKGLRKQYAMSLHVCCLQLYSQHSS